MIIKPTIIFNRRYRHLLGAIAPSNHEMTKPRRPVPLVDGDLRWRNEQVIKVHFAGEPSIEIAIGGCASSLRKKSKS